MLAELLPAFLASDVPGHVKRAFIARAPAECRAVIEAALHSDDPEIRIGAALNPLVADRPEVIAILRAEASCERASRCLGALERTPIERAELASLCEARLGDTGSDEDTAQLLGRLGRQDVLVRVLEAAAPSEAGVLSAVLLGLAELGSSLDLDDKLFDRIAKIAAGDGMAKLDALIALTAAGIPGAAEALAAHDPETAISYFGIRAARATIERLATIEPTSAEAVRAFRALRDVPDAHDACRRMVESALAIALTLRPKTEAEGHKVVHAWTILEVAPAAVLAEADLRPLRVPELWDQLWGISQRSFVTAVLQLGSAAGSLRADAQALVVEQAKTSKEKEWWAKLLPLVDTDEARAMMQGLLNKPPKWLQGLDKDRLVQTVTTRPAPVRSLSDLGVIRTMLPRVGEDAVFEAIQAGMPGLGKQLGEGYSKIDLCRDAFAELGASEAGRRVLTRLAAVDDLPTALLADEALRCPWFYRRPGESFAARHASDQPPPTRPFRVGAPIAAAQAAEGSERDTTAALLVRGRVYSGTMSRALISALEAAVNGTELAVVPAADFSETGPGDDEEIEGSIAVGVVEGEAAADDGSPSKIKVGRPTAIEPALWAALEAVPSQGRWSDDQLILVATGPLATAYLACGKLGRAEDACTAGATMEQEPHRRGVQGVCLAQTSDITPITLDPKADKARAVGAKVASYYLVARYD